MWFSSYRSERTFGVERVAERDACSRFAPPFGFSAAERMFVAMERVNKRPVGGEFTNPTFARRGATNEW